METQVVMQKQPRHRLTTSNASAETLARSPTLNNLIINRSFSWALLFLLIVTGSNCLAESDYKDMGNAFDFFDKMDAEESSKKVEQAKKPVKTAEKPKPLIEGLDSVVKEITKEPSVNKAKQNIKKEVVKTLPRQIKTAKRTAAPIKKNSFQKRNTTGEKLSTEAKQWSCVEDAVNKLVWEVKTSNGKKQDKNHTYTWYNPEPNDTQNNNSGAANGGRCKGGVPCDTHAYVQAINQQKLCGYSDWRLPTRKEMLSLIGQKTSKTGATINQKYFPDAMPSWYWTASANEEHPEYAWYVLFRNGITLNDLKERPKHIRLVRGGINRFASTD